MKTPSKIFILVLLLLAFLAALAWAGVRHLSDILREFDHVAQVDLMMMKGTADLKDIQLEKEIVFARLSSASEELAFSQINDSRKQYLVDYVKGLGEQFDRYVQSTEIQMQKIDTFSGIPDDLKDSFKQLGWQTQQYDSTVQAIFKEVEKGDFNCPLKTWSIQILCRKH